MNPSTAPSPAEMELQKATLWAKHPDVFSNKWTPERQAAQEKFAAEYVPGAEYISATDDSGEDIILAEPVSFSNGPTQAELDAMYADIEAKFGKFPPKIYPRSNPTPHEKYYRLEPVSPEYGKGIIEVYKQTPKTHPLEFVQRRVLADGSAEKIKTFLAKTGKTPDNIYPVSHVETEDDARKVLKNVIVGKRLNIHGATSFDTRKIKWLWNQRVPLGKLTLFVGVPGGGKSLAAGDVAARLSTGKDWFDATNVFKPSETLMLIGEDDVEDTTIPRLQAAGADLKKIFFLKSVTTEETPNKSAIEREFQFDQDLQQIEDFLDSHPNIRLIVVDPVSNYMGSAKMNSEQEVRSVLIPLKNLAEKKNVAVIGIMHLNKKVETDAINRVGGAMAFIGVARAAYLFQKKEAESTTLADYSLDQHYMVLLKCNITKKVDGLVYEIAARPVDVEGSPEHMPYIKYISTTTKSAEGVLQPKSETAGRPANHLSKAKRWLEGYLKDGKQTANDIKAAGKNLEDLSATTIDRAKIELGIFAEKVGTKWYWSLPVKEEISLEPVKL
jgi:putative DNA primase/helicase